MLPVELLDTLYTSFPCRELQIRVILKLLCNADLPSPPVLIIYGTEATGKSTITKGVFDAAEISYAWVNCKECITLRHFLEKVYCKCAEVIEISSGTTGIKDSPSRPDSLTALAAQLQKLLVDAAKIVLVLDGVDKQREMTPMMLSGLARLAQMIPSLSLVMITSSTTARFLTSVEPPSLHFPAYTKDQTVKILSLNPKTIFEVDSEDEYTEEMLTEDRWLWGQCCSAIWDTIGKYAAKNINELRDVLEEVWKPLIQPIINNEYGIRDFSRLFNRLKNEKLKNNEEVFVNAQVAERKQVGDRARIYKSHDLPYISRYLLCAAFLASYNTAKYDSRYFSKLPEERNKKRKTRRKQNTSRQLNRKHLGPRPFPMERLLAIFQAIMPNHLPDTVDIGSQVATLASLRLISKVSGISAVTDASSKWKVNIGYDYARRLGRTVKLEIENHMEE